MTFASITSMFRSWGFHQPLGPATEPRVYTPPSAIPLPEPDPRRVLGETLGKLLAAKTELAGVKRERDELRIALGSEERAHEAAAEKCRELTASLDVVRRSNNALANECVALNKLLDEARELTREARADAKRARRLFCRTEHQVHELAVERAELRKRLGLNQ